MKTVSVSELKAHLSRYLREVRRGGEVQILDRGVPVARLAGLPAGNEANDEEQRQRLLSAGVLRPGHGKVHEAIEAPALDLPVSIAEAVDADRADRL